MLESCAAAAYLLGMPTTTLSNVNVKTRPLVSGLCYGYGSGSGAGSEHQIGVPTTAISKLG